MSIVLSDGGHLTHGSPVNISGKWLKPIHYPLTYDESREDYGRIDYDAVAQLAAEHKPKLIMCGYSAYPRLIDFARFRRIADDCGAWLMADIAHVAGLVVGGVHPSPFPHAHVVTTTTHKTLRGPRGGLVLAEDEDLAKRIDKAVFPGIQGGPLMHIIAAKAVCFGEALRPQFKEYAAQIVANAKALAEALMALGHHLCSRGTDNHLMLIDLRKQDSELTGKQAALWLEQAGIITNKNTVPGEERSPFQTSGLRLGTPALTTRGLTEAEMPTVAELIDRGLRSGGDEAVLDVVREQVQDICGPLPHAALIDRNEVCPLQRACAPRYTVPMPLRVLIIVPAFNEAGSIAGVVTQINQSLPDADVLVIDDGSTDRTAHAVPDGAAVVRLPFNLGIGGAMQTGYRYAAMNDYDVAVQIDADGQHPPDQVSHLLSKLHDDDVNLVVGSRFLASESYTPSPSRMVGISLLRGLVRMLTGLPITDPTSGFRAADRRVIHAFAYWYPEDYPEPEVILLLHRAGFRVAETPVAMADRAAGQTSIPFTRGVFYLVKVAAALLLDLFRNPWPKERITPP